MPTLLPYRYPVDLTGTSLDNAVADEPHQMVRRKIRCIAPMYAPFFKDSLQIFEPGNPTPLAPSRYKCMNLIPLPTAMAGGNKEVYAIIAITDESVGDDVSLTYQTVGGDFVQSYEAALTLLNANSQDTRPVAWPNIVDRPLVYPPNLHLHAIGDAIDWQYLSVAVQQIRESILNGDARDHQAILQYIDGQTAALQTLINSQFDANKPLGAHIAATNNPHNTTKAQVGLDLVQNFPVATNAEALAGTALNRYMTPSLVQAAVANVSGVSLGGHPADKNNPHETNAAQVGLGNVPNYPPASNAEGVTGTATNRLMTPAATKAAIQAKIDQVGAIGAAHIADHNNPHLTTAAQLDLGNVPNYAPATPAEVVTGTATNKLVTPAGVKAAFDVVKTDLNTALTNHVNNQANPHAVTKAQVDLALVENYPPATNAEAVTGTATNRYVTPANLKAVMQSVSLDLTTKVDVDSVGQANGVAPLGTDALIDVAFLLNAPGSTVRDVAFSKAGHPLSGSVLHRYVVARPMQWDANFAGSMAWANVAPDAAATVTVRRNGTVVGTITFASGSKTGTWVGSTSYAVAGDSIDFTYGGADTTLTDLVINMQAKAYSP